MIDRDLTNPSRPARRLAEQAATEVRAETAPKRRFPFSLRTIQARLILAFVLMGLLPAVITTTASTILNVRDGQTKAIDQLESVATLKRAQVLTWVTDTQDELATQVNERTLALIPFVLPGSGSARLQEDSANRLRSIFRDSLQRTQRFETFFLTDLEGNVLVASETNLEGASLGAATYFQQAVTGPSIEPLAYSPEQGRVVLTLFQPVEERGEVIAILGGQASIEALNAIMIERAGLGDTGQTYLVDAGFSLLTDSRFEGYAVGETKVNSEGVTTTVAQKVDETSSYQDYRGETVFGVHYWVPELQVALVAERTRSEALRATIVNLALNITAAGVTALLAIGVGLVLARSIAVPLSDLAQTASRIADGNLSLTAKVQQDNEIGALARSFNTMTNQLRELISGLEARVEARTRDLQVAADVSRQAATLLNLDELLPQFVELARTGFNLYYVSVFLYDEESKLLHLEAGSQEAGKQMKAAGKSFTLDAKGLVPQAARIQKPVVVNDVTTTPDHFYNPVLPDTRSEMAVPMIVGTGLVGVLDIQSEKLERFTEDDVRVITSLASQLAVAVRNAQLYAAQVQVAEKLAALDNLKSQFMASMSHELRTPLNAILNFTQFVASGLFGEVNERQVDALSKATASGEHLLSLINDVLDITKIEAGMMELFVEDDVNLNEELKSVTTMAESLSTQKAIKLILEIDNKLPQIIGDRRRIRQILINLVSNAVKFTDTGSVTIGARAQGDEVVFVVKDTGPGIAPEEQAMIFEPFRQAQAGLRKSTGTGLGLAIAKRLAEAHGGRLWLESEVKVGSSFYVALPVQSTQLAAMVERFS